MRADMAKKPEPLLNPGTLEPLTAEELSGIFCEELVAQELDDDTRDIEIPEEVRAYYKTYRPAPESSHAIKAAMDEAIRCRRWNKNEDPKKRTPKKSGMTNLHSALPVIQLLCIRIIC